MDEMFADRWFFFVDYVPIGDRENETQPGSGLSCLSELR